MYICVYIYINRQKLSVLAFLQRVYIYIYIYIYIYNIYTYVYIYIYIIRNVMVKRPTPIYNVAKLVLFAQRFDHHGLHQER